jgi:hypothetical protein
MDASDWYTVEFDDEHIHLHVSPPGREPWEAEIAWADIVRVCFKAEDLFVSDGIYLFVRQRPESYAIPTEALGGAELWGAIVHRGLFDAGLAIRAATATNELFCWPPDSPIPGATAMDKQTFLQTVRETRADFDAAVGSVPPTQMEQPGAGGAMSVKDIIAHVTWFEREMIGVLRERALVGSAWWQLPQDERNAAILAANRDHPLADVLQDAARTWQEFIAALEALDEEALNDSSHFRDMPADWVPWDLIAGNSSRHYADHAVDIRAWLAS